MAGVKKTWVKPQLTRLKLTEKEIEVLFPGSKDRVSQRWHEKREGRAA